MKHKHKGHFIKREWAFGGSTIYRVCTICKQEIGVWSYGYIGVWSYGYKGKAMLLEE